MREIRTPGLMSGDGKRDHELYVQSTRAHPRLYYGASQLVEPDSNSPEAHSPLKASGRGETP